MDLLYWLFGESLSTATLPTEPYTPKGRLESIVYKTADERLGEKTRKGLGGIRPEHRFVEDLGYDSLNRGEFIFALEERFDITIQDAEAQNLKTVQQVVNYVRQRKTRL
ncbi:MAG TPA: phosphopantetheine-binding protein [archaeon]|nr:phosphopantetheine-binding protein [archaeon]